MQNIKNKELYDTLKSYLDYEYINKIINKNDKILIAFSGGPDSVFLFYFLNSLLDKYKLYIELAYINHNIRDDVENDIKFVKEFAKRNNVNYSIRNVDVISYSKINKISTELAARELRYNELNEILKEKKLTKIATGHNLDDNVETFIFRLLRGTSLNGLKSIQSNRNNVIRPILNIEKTIILRILENIDEWYVIDYTNNENIYTRNIIRNTIFPMFEDINPKFRDKIINIINEINNIEDNVNNYSSIEDNILHIDQIEEVVIKDEHLLNKIIVKYFEKNNIEINKEKINNTKELIFSKGSKIINLSKDKILCKEYNKLIIKKVFEIENIENKKTKLEINKINKFNDYIIKIVKTKQILSEDLEYINHTLASVYTINKDILDVYSESDSVFYVRSKIDGDKIKLKNNITKKLKDIFINKKIVKWDRSKIPVVEIEYENVYNSGSNLLFVGDVAYSQYVKKIDTSKFEQIDTNELLTFIVWRKNGR